MVEDRSLHEEWKKNHSVFRYLEDDAHAPLARDCTLCSFHLGTKFVFSLQDTRMKSHTRTRISFELKTGMNSFWNDINMSSRDHVNRCSEIYDDGMNFFWSMKTRSGMKLVPLSCKEPLSFNIVATWCVSE